MCLIISVLKIYLHWRLVVFKFSPSDKISHLHPFTYIILFGLKILFSLVNNSISIRRILFIFHHNNIMTKKIIYPKKNFFIIRHTSTFMEVTYQKPSEYFSHNSACQKISSTRVQIAFARTRVHTLYSKSNEECAKRTTRCRVARENKVRIPFWLWQREQISLWARAPTTESGTRNSEPGTAWELGTGSEPIDIQVRLWGCLVWVCVFWSMRNRKEDIKNRTYNMFVTILQNLSVRLYHIKCWFFFL